VHQLLWGNQDFSSALQRRSLPLVPRRTSFPLCVGNVQRYRYESIFVLAPCPASARCTCTKTLNKSPSTFLLNFPPIPLFFFCHCSYAVWHYVFFLCVSTERTLRCSVYRMKSVLLFERTCPLLIPRSSVSVVTRLLAG
jgi:hypothetical protein